MSATSSASTWGACSAICRYLSPIRTQSSFFLTGVRHDFPIEKNFLTAQNDRQPLQARRLTPSAGRSSIPGYDRRKPCAYECIVDLSVSMQNYIPTIKRELISWMNNIKPGSSVFILGFGDNAVVIFKTTSLDEYSPKQALTTNLNICKQWETPTWKRH